MKQQLILSSTTDQLELEVWDHNVKVVPTSALVTIIIWGNEEVTDDSATVSATGTCSYIPGATVLDELAEDCVVQWDLTIDGEQKSFRQMFDVVLHPLHPAVTDEDLIAECAQLQDARYMEAGLAESGSSVSLVSILLQEYQDNHFQGGTLEITDGACAGEKKRITGNVRATGVLMLDASLSTSVDSTSRFVARRSFQREIDRAWEDIEAMIQTKGYRPALIVNSEDIRPVHLCWTLVKVCRNLAKSPDDIWWRRAETFNEEYASKLGMVNFAYDKNEDEWPESRKTFKPAFRR
jgi:hypothetical protein